MRKLSVVLAFSLLVSPALAQADDELTGDVALACEAILCLSSAVQPAECAPSLSRYFGIVYKYWSDTVTGRINFLNLCPVVSEDTNMRPLVNAIANGAGMCDVASLNSYSYNYMDDSGQSYISNVMPSYCTAYMTNPYTDFADSMPRYVGTPEQGGYWVEAANYDQALKDYNDRLAAIQAAQEYQYQYQN